MNKIFAVPLEIFEERYTKQWSSWFVREFNNMNLDFEMVVGECLTSKIETGSFLDICGTNYYKASQLMLLTKYLYEKKIQEGDCIFFFDLWFPGIEMLQYIRQGMDINFKICGILHAGTYDPYDFLSKQGMGVWGKQIEESWFSFIDKIFVATQFHKQLILDKRACENKKIVVTGLPIYFNEIKGSNINQKDDIVVFPHRLDPEKNPQEFDKLKNRFPKWDFVKTKQICQTKEEYYDLLSQSKIVVSFSDQETWGIAQQEAVANKCFPVVPNRLSYVEMYPKIFRYDSFLECCEIIQKIMNCPKKYEEKRQQTEENLKLKGEKAMLNIIRGVQLCLKK